MPKPDPRLLEPDRYPVQFALTTRFQDLDPNHHINNVATAAMFEDVRVRFDWGAGLREEMDAAGYRPMIVSVGIEYLGEAFYPDPMVAHAGGLSFGRTSWSIGALLTQNGRATAFMRSTVACTRDGVPATLPEPFRAAMETRMIRLHDI
ncbi:MAG: acyl-CoA thioesterase [Sphingobium sp.]